MPKNQAEKLAIEAHASYIIINSRFIDSCSRSAISSNDKLFIIREKAANRLYRRYQLAYGK